MSTSAINRLLTPQAFAPTGSDTVTSTGGQKTPATPQISADPAAGSTVSPKPSDQPNTSARPAWASPANVAQAKTDAATAPAASGLSPAAEQFAVKSLVAAVMGGAQPSAGNLPASDAAKAKQFVSDFVDQATKGSIDPSKDGVRQAAVKELRALAKAGDAGAQSALPLLENLKVKGSDVQSVQPTVPSFSELSPAAQKYVVGSVLSGIESGKALSTKGLSPQDAQAGGAVLEKFLGQVGKGSITPDQQPIRIGALAELQIKKLNADPKNGVLTNNLNVMTQLLKGLEIKSAAPTGDAASQPIQQLTPNAEKFVVKAFMLMNDSVPKENLPTLTDAERKAASTAASQITRGIQAQNIDPAYQGIVKAVIAALKADPGVDPAKIATLEAALEKSPQVPK